MRRVRAMGWPTLRQRLVYALVAWLPLAIVTSFGAFTTANCGLAGVDCPAALEVGLLGFVGLLLLLLVALPKIAYAAATGTVAMLVAAVVTVGVLAFMRAPLPPATAALIVVGAVMAVTYVAATLVAGLRGPWRAEPAP